MFGFKRANQSKPEQDHIHFGFDGATASDMQNSVQALSDTDIREQQSMQEHFRELAMGIIASLVEQVGEGKLDEDTLPTDVLDALMLNATDGLDDPETDDTAWELLLGSLQDAFNAFGVDDSALSEMFNDDLAIADAAIESVCDTVLANMPDDGEPLDDFIRDFVYADDGEASFDSLAVGKTMVRKVAGKNIQYKAKAVIRRGKKVVVHKRLPNQKVRLTAKQKGALTKARMKAHTANAIKMRVKSFKKGRKLGYY